MVLSRSLPAGDIGVYFFALSFAESFIVLASFRLNPVLMQRTAADAAQTTAHLSSLLGFRLLSVNLLLHLGYLGFQMPYSEHLIFPM